MKKWPNAGILEGEKRNVAWRVFKMLSILACHSKDEDYMFWLEEKTFTRGDFI